MAHLYIIRGVPGSGKTTLAESMMECGMVDHYSEADRFMVDDFLQYKFDATNLRMCHELCRQDVEEFLNMGCSVAVSNTFTRKWEMQPYLDMAEKYGAKVTVIVCQGDYANVHGVPSDKVQEMKRRFEY
jgi:predicted kinase